MSINYKGTEIESLMYGGKPDGDPVLKAEYEDILARKPPYEIENPDWDHWNDLINNYNILQRREQEAYQRWQIAVRDPSIPQEEKDRLYGEYRYYEEQRQHIENEIHSRFPNGAPPQYIKNPDFIIWQQEESVAYQKWQKTVIPATEITEAYKWDPNKNQYVLVFALTKDIQLEARAYIGDAIIQNNKYKVITLKVNYIYKGKKGIAPKDISATVSTSFSYNNYIHIPGLDDSSFTINKGDSGGEQEWKIIYGSSYFDLFYMHNTISLSTGQTFYFNIDGNRFITQDQLYYNHYDISTRNIIEPDKFKLNSDAIIMTGHTERVGTSWVTKYKFTVKWATPGPHPRDAVCWLEDFHGNNFKSLYLSKDSNETLVAEGNLDKGTDYNNTGVYFCVKSWGFTYTSPDILSTISTGAKKYWVGWWGGSGNADKTLNLAAWKDKGGDGDDYPWPG